MSRINTVYHIFLSLRELKMEESSMSRTSCRELLNLHPVRVNTCSTSKQLFRSQRICVEISCHSWKEGCSHTSTMLKWQHCLLQLHVQVLQVYFGCRRLIRNKSFDRWQPEIRNRTTNNYSVT